MDINSETVGDIFRLSTANWVGPATLDEFVTSTWEHRAEYGDDAEDFGWFVFGHEDFVALAAAEVDGAGA